MTRLFNVLIPMLKLSVIMNIMIVVDIMDSSWNVFHVQRTFLVQQCVVFVLSHERAELVALQLFTIIFRIGRI